MSYNPGGKVSYRKPPLIEVVCGVQFEAVSQFTVGHVGKLWDAKYPAYRECVELFPLITALEPLPNISLPNNLSVGQTLMPRCGLIAADNSAIIQVQRDAFYYNWQKKDADDAYPRYEIVVDRFESEFKAFEEFLSGLGGSIRPLQFELTYLNEIPIRNEYHGLQVLKDARWVEDDSRYLPDPEIISLDCSFLLRSGNGRLRNQFKNMLKSDGSMVYQWSLSVRGIDGAGSRLSPAAMRKWFDEARECIVHSFADLADVEFQNRVWERVYE